MNYDKNITYTFAARRAFFDIYTKHINTELATCQCCGYPTLPERDAWNMCYLCFWEDDGQDDADADVILSGPNSNFSLSMARLNFDKYYFMYGDGVEQNAIIKSSKYKVINTFNDIIKEPNEIIRLKLWTQVIERYEDFKILILNNI